MQARFLEQAAAPADARDDVAVDRGDVRGERLVEPRGDVREQLVAAVGAGGDDRVGAARQRDDRGRPRGRLRTGRRSRPRARRRACARASAPAATARRRARRREERSRDRESSNQVANATWCSLSRSCDTQLLHDLDDPRRGVGAVAEDLRLLALALRARRGAASRASTRAATARRPRAASTSRAAGRAPTDSAAGSGPRAPSAPRAARPRTRRARRPASRSTRARPSASSIFFSPVTTGSPSAYATRIPTW